MLYFNVPLTLVACFFLALHLVNVYSITPHLQHIYRDVFQKGADAQSFLIESLSGLSTIKSLGIEHLTRWQAENLYIRSTKCLFENHQLGYLLQLDQWIGQQFERCSCANISLKLCIRVSKPL